VIRVETKGKIRRWHSVDKLSISKTARCAVSCRIASDPSAPIIPLMALRDERHAVYSKTTACTVSALPKAPVDE
jgi:hypothetical protein